MIGRKDIFKLIVDAVQPMPNKLTLGNRNHLDEFAKPKYQNLYDKPFQGFYSFHSSKSSAAFMLSHQNPKLSLLLHHFCSSSLACLFLCHSPFLDSQVVSKPSFRFIIQNSKVIFLHTRLKILLVDFSLKFQIVAIVAIHRLVDIQRQ